MFLKRLIAISVLLGVLILIGGVVSKNSNPPWEEKFSGEPSLGFSVMPTPEGYRFTLVGVTDEDGRKIEGSNSASSNTNWGFSLRPKGESAKSRRDGGIAPQPLR